MNFTALICLMLAQYLLGYGTIKLFKVELERLPLACLSMITGVSLISFIPPVLQLMHIPIDTGNVAKGIIVFTVLMCIPIGIFFKKPTFKKIRFSQLYELPFLIVMASIIVISVWRCFYLPSNPRDLLTGPELLAEYAVKEKTLISSVYSIDLHTTNNYLKSPFITGLQIIYKLYINPIGQIWLSMIFVPFIVWFYTILSQRIHRFIVGILMVIFLCVPDMFAYTYIVLYDYSNMVFFFIGFYFLIRYLEDKRMPDLAFSAFLLGMATYIRVETLILVGMFLPLLAYELYKEKVAVSKIAMRSGIVLLVSAVFYFICMNLFVKRFVPIPFDASGQVNHNPADISVFFKRLSDMSSLFFFTEKSMQIYGYFYNIFCAVLLADLIFIRKFSREARFALYGVVVIYLGLPFLGYLIPLFDLPNTTKRGLFKIVPLMLLYMANSGVLQKLSEFLKNREIGKPRPEKAIPQVKPVPVAKPKPVAPQPAPRQGKGRK